MSDEIRILTLWQPWASAIALGKKHYETRSWKTDYRGKLLIHAAKRKPAPEEIQAITNTPTLHHHHLAHDGCVMWLLHNPLGCIVAIADLTDRRMMTPKYSTLEEKAHTYINDQSDLEIALGDWKMGRYAWKLENIITLPAPIPCKGGQGLRKVTDEKILNQVASVAP